MNEIFFAFGGEFVAIAGLVLAAAGTAVSTYASIASASAQKKSAEYSAAVERNAAATAHQQAEFDAQQIRDKTRRLVSSQRAAFSASGVDPNSGSAFDVQSDTKTQGEMEALIAIYTGRSASTAHMSQSRLDSMRASYAGSAGYLGAGSSLLTGGANIASIKWPTKNPKVEG